MGVVRIYSVQTLFHSSLAGLTCAHICRNPLPRVCFTVTFSCALLEAHLPSQHTWGTPQSPGITDTQAPPCSWCHSLWWVLGWDHDSALLPHCACWFFLCGFIFFIENLFSIKSSPSIVSPLHLDVPSHFLSPLPLSPTILSPSILSPPFSLPFPSLLCLSA